MLKISVNNLVYDDFERICTEKGLNKYDVLYNKVLQSIKIKDNNFINWYSIINNYEFINNRFVEVTTFNDEIKNILFDFAKNKNIKTSKLMNVLILYIIKPYVNFRIERYIKDKKYSNIIYPQEILEYNLEEQIKINIINKIRNEKAIIPKFCKNMDEIIDLYCNLYKMRYIFNYAPKEIEFCFNRVTSIRAIEAWLKKLNWQFGAFEAQQLTVKRGCRNYTQIRKQARKTQIKNKLKGSNEEEYIRQTLNVCLSEMLLNCEVIVGLNNLSILNDEEKDNNGQEIDIPIIVINNENTYKFAIEVNGDYWHENNISDEEKKYLIKAKHYKLFYICLADNTRLQREKYGTIDNQISNVSKEIKNIIES